MKVIYDQKDPLPQRKSESEFVYPFFWEGPDGTALIGIIALLLIWLIFF